MVYVQITKRDAKFILLQLRVFATFNDILAKEQIGQITIVAERLKRKIKKV